MPKGIYIHSKGKQAPHYKDGRTLKEYFCIDCNKSLSNDHRAKRCSSCAARRRFKVNWRNLKIRNKTIRSIMKANRIKPNKPEKLLNRVLQSVLPKEYRLNVKANIMILAGKIPDFVNVNGQKKIIELYGDYWHNLPNHKKSDKKRIILFRNLGFKTLVIWEHELENLDKVTGKILIFNKEN